VRVRFLNVVYLQIEELPAIIREDVEDFLETPPRSPAAQLRPKFGVVGNVWLAYIGPRLQRGAQWLGARHRVMPWRISTCASWNRSFLEAVLSRN